MWGRIAGVWVVAWAFVLGVVGGTAGAQPLADRVPGDAIVYVGWAGADGLPGYEQSHLKAVVESSDWPKVFGEFMPALIQRVGREDANGAEKLKLLQAVAGPMWRHPSAVYVTGIDFTRPNKLRVNMAVLCAAGAESEALLKQLQGALAQARVRPADAIEARMEGDLVALTIGKPGKASVQGALAAAPAFVEAMAGVKQQVPALVGYVDAEGLWKMIDRGVAAGRDARVKDQWPKWRDALGLPGIKRFAWTGGFQGQGWVTQSFLAAPAPRSGIVTAFEGTGGVSDAALKVIPQTATVASAFKFDLSKLVAEVRTALGKVDPNAQQQMDQAMGFVSMTMGANVKTDLIDSLGDEWVIYTDPTVGGNGFVGGALVNRLRDAQREEQALGAMEVAFNNVVASRMKNEKMTIAIRTTERDGLTIHYLAFPIVSPAWAIRDGNLYVGLYPQVVAGSAAFVKSGGKSILENPQFQAARKGLPGADEAKQTSGVSFVDLPRTAASAYPMWLMISRYAGFADLFGVQSPPMLLPPLASIQGHLTPAASASWWDATGRHSVGTSPFPMSGTMASDPTQMTVAAPAVMMSVLLPSLNRARETANRVKCGSNLRQMGQGMFLYSNEHKGKLPPDMGTIVLTQELGPEVFICPSGNNALPANWREMQPDEVAAWINKNADYVYLGKGKTNSESPETILIYEKTDAHGGDGMNILFGDGHVEFLRHDAARKEILKQTGKDIGGAGEEPVGAQPGAGQPGAP